MFTLLLPRYKGAPPMVVLDSKMYLLAWLACTRGTPQTVARAVWEAVATPKPPRPLERVMLEPRKWRATAARVVEIDVPGVQVTCGFGTGIANEGGHIVREQL